MCKHIICLLPSRARAESVVLRLRAAALKAADISVLFPEPSGDANGSGPVDQMHARPDSGEPPHGPFIGGVFSLLVSVGVLAIPGAGPHVAAGPIIAALSGGAMGAAVGGIAGGLVWMGMSERQARQYAARVDRGCVLVAVVAQGEGEAMRAQMVLRESRAEHIRVLEESALPNPQGPYTHLLGGVPPSMAGMA